MRDPITWDDTGAGDVRVRIGRIAESVSPGAGAEIAATPATSKFFVRETPK